jgi:hypothetical protein
MLQTVEMSSTIITDLQTIAVETCSIILCRPHVTSAERTFLPVNSVEFQGNSILVLLIVRDSRFFYSDAFVAKINIHCSFKDLNVTYLNDRLVDTETKALFTHFCRHFMVWNSYHVIMHPVNAHKCTTRHRWDFELHVKRLIFYYKNLWGTIKHEIKWSANLMQLGNFIDVFFARHVSGTYGHHQEY